MDNETDSTSSPRSPSVSGLWLPLVTPFRASALALWLDLGDVVRLLFAEPSPAPLKHWLCRMGLIAAPELRLPIASVTPSLAGRLDRMFWARRVGTP